MFSFVEMLVKRTAAPSWFYIAKKDKAPDYQIKEKIKLELYHDVREAGFDPMLWDDAFIAKVSELYYKFFNQLYSQSN